MFKKETCPVCEGTTKMVPSEQLKKFIRSCPSAYSSEFTEESVPCNNCGGQTQNGTPTGYVYVVDGKAPCTHDYRSEFLTSSYAKYTCIHCGSIHYIDSGD